MGNLTDELSLYSSLNDKTVIHTNNIQKNINGDNAENIADGYVDAFSTDSPLDDSEIFDSGIQDLDGFQFVAGEISSDQNGTFKGEWYDDIQGTNLLRSFEAPYQSANGLSFLSVPKLSQFFRITFENNSGVNQSYIHIRLKVSNTSYSPQLIQADQFLPTNAIASVVRSILTGKNAVGDFVNVGTNDVGALNTSDFLLDVVQGKYPTYKSGLKFGRNPDIDANSVPEDIFNGSGAYQGQPTTGIAETVDVTSTESVDNSSGAGARTLKLEGLDIDGNSINEIITLDGIAPVTSSLSYWRLSRAYVLTAGSLGYNNGTITINHTTTTANVFANIATQTNQTAVCADTVPKGKKRIVLFLGCEIARANGSAGSSNARFLVREQGSVFRAIINTEITTAFPYENSLKTGLVFPELTDMKWQIFDVSDNSTIATASFEFIDIDV